MTSTPIVLHEHGDVTLILGLEEQRVHVSISIMRRASPVWRAMFSYRWAESEATEIYFPDDDVEAMVTVLRIAHLRFREIPQEGQVDFRQLLNIAVICDKYDLVSLVRPFMDLHGWAKDLEHLHHEDGYEEWLFIAWTFGFMNTFESLSRQLVNKVEGIDEHGDCLVAKGVVLKPIMPPDIVESIMRTRNEAVNKILSGCHRILNQALNAHVCTLGRDEQHCQSVILGSLVKIFHELNIYPNLPYAEDYHCSLEKLSRTLQSTPVLAYSTSIYEPFKGSIYSSHEDCAKNLGLASMVKQVIRNMKYPVLESHRNHIIEQEKK